MPRRLLLLNTTLVAIAGVLVAFIAWQLTRPVASRPGAAGARPAAATTRPPAVPSPEVAAAPGSYGIIASRNLFSPTRSDVPAVAAGGAGAPAAQVPKPSLYGIVLREGAPIAYLEDPVTKRVAGYRVGDAVAGGTLKSIDADRVVLTRPEGTVDVRLHDPSKPRPVAGPGGPTPSVAGTPAVAPPSLPGLIPPVPTPTRPSVQAPGPGQVGIQTPGTVPGRRPLPPNLLRRFQQNQPGNVPAR
jgi:hypothetical protein